MEAAADIRIATARWNIPLDAAARVDPDRKREGSLARYARLLGASEVNSSFYRHHMPGTWARWAGATPAGFRFSIKLPRMITHDARLDPAASQPILDRFLHEVSHLAGKAGPLLVQLPPSLVHDRDRVDEFLSLLRDRWEGLVACEPRHATWFEPAVDELLERHRVARVVADPLVDERGAEPGGWGGLVYVRLHGSPRMYHSSYDDDYLAALAGQLRALAAGGARDVWCVFDNTAGGAALGNALTLTGLLGASPPRGDEGPRYRIISVR